MIFRAVLSGAPQGSILGPLWLDVSNSDALWDWWIQLKRLQCFTCLKKKVCWDDGGSTRSWTEADRQVTGVQVQTGRLTDACVSYSLTAERNLKRRKSPTDTENHWTPSTLTWIYSAFSVVLWSKGLYQVSRGQVSRGQVSSAWDETDEFVDVL